jgi:hypothetical protein
MLPCKLELDKDFLAMRGGLPRGLFCPGLSNDEGDDPAVTCVALIDELASPLFESRETLDEDLFRFFLLSVGVSGRTS